MSLHDLTVLLVYPLIPALVVFLILRDGRRAKQAALRRQPAPDPPWQPHYNCRCVLVPAADDRGSVARVEP